MEYRWRDIDSKMADCYEKNCSKPVLSSTNATGTGLKSNPCLHGKSSATKYLSLGTTSDYEWVDKGWFVSPTRQKNYSPDIPPPDKPRLPKHSYCRVSARSPSRSKTHTHTHTHHTHTHTHTNTPHTHLYICIYIPYIT